MGGLHFDIQAASGRRDSITVFGRDYPIEDGTCIRDIQDLCFAHALALDKIIQSSHSGQALAYNHWKWLRLFCLASDRYGE